MYIFILHILYMLYIYIFILYILYTLVILYIRGSIKHQYSRIRAAKAARIRDNLQDDATIVAGAESQRIVAEYKALTGLS